MHAGSVNKGSTHLYPIILGIPGYKIRHEVLFVTSGCQSFADEASDVTSLVTCESQPFFDAEEPNGAVDRQIQAQRDWCGYQRDWSEPGAACAASEPHDGLPASMPPRVVVTIKLGIHTQSHFPISIPSLTIRDLGRLMHDLGGHFKIYVEYAARSFTPRGEGASLTTLEPYAWGQKNAFWALASAEWRPSGCRGQQDLL